MHHTIVCGMSVWGDNGNAVSDFVQKVRDHEASKLVNITEKPYTQAEIEILVGPLNLHQIYHWKRFEIIFKKIEYSPEERQMLENLAAYIKKIDNPSLNFMDVFE